MQKTDLINLGLTAEQASSVMNLYKNSLNDNYIPKYRFDEINNELKEVKQQVKTRDGQIKDLSGLQSNNQELQNKLKELQEMNSKQQTDYANQLNQMKKANAIKITLLNSENKPHDLKMVMDLINLDKIKLNDSGEIIDGYQNQINSLKEEKGFLFQTNNNNNNSSATNNITGAVPNNSGIAENLSNELLDFGKKLAEQTNSLYRQSFGDIPNKTNRGV